MANARKRSSKPIKRYVDLPFFTVDQQHYENVKSIMSEGYRILPKTFLEEEYFPDLATDELCLYCYLLNLVGLSQIHHWAEFDRVFVRLSNIKIQKLFRCGNQKATQMLIDLETAGLIKRETVGIGKADVIFPKDYTVLIASGEHLRGSCKYNADDQDKADRHGNHDPSVMKIMTDHHENHDPTIMNSMTNIDLLNDTTIFKNDTNNLGIQVENNSYVDSNTNQLNHKSKRAYMEPPPLFETGESSPKHSQDEYENDLIIRKAPELWLSSRAILSNANNSKIQGEKKR